MIDSSRCKILRVDTRLLLHLLRAHGDTSAFRMVQHALPEDARLLNARWNLERGVFELLFLSESFEPVPLGQEYPWMEPPEIVDVQLGERSIVLQQSEFA